MIPYGPLPAARSLWLCVNGVNGVNRVTRFIVPANAAALP